MFGSFEKKRGGLEKGRTTAWPIKWETLPPAKGGLGQRSRRRRVGKKTKGENGATAGDIAKPQEERFMRRQTSRSKKKASGEKKSRSPSRSATGLGEFPIRGLDGGEKGGGSSGRSRNLLGFHPDAERESARLYRMKRAAFGTGRGFQRGKNSSPSAKFRIEGSCLGNETKASVPTAQE